MEFTQKLNFVRVSTVNYLQFLILKFVTNMYKNTLILPISVTSEAIWGGGCNVDFYLILCFNLFLTVVVNYYGTHFDIVFFSICPNAVLCKPTCRLMLSQDATRSTRIFSPEFVNFNFQTLKKDAKLVTIIPKLSEMLTIFN